VDHWSGTFTVKCGCCAKVPENKNLNSFFPVFAIQFENSKERKFQGLIGSFVPRSELAQEHKASRDVTKFKFEFHNVRTLNVFNRFEI